MAGHVQCFVTLTVPPETYPAACQSISLTKTRLALAMELQAALLMKALVKAEQQPAVSPTLVTDNMPPPLEPGCNDVEMA